jgi:hypothetical protein
MSVNHQRLMSTGPIIDYEKLVESYWENLTTVLRGFGPAEGFEFLETWVPDDDAVMNIMNIIDAAKEAGLPNVSFYFGANTLQTLELPRLQEMSAEMGGVQAEAQGEGLRFDLTFIEPDQLLEISSIYRNRLRTALQSSAHQRVLEAAAGLEFVQATSDGVKLTALVDSSEHVIRKAAHQGTVSEVQRCLLELLCGILEGKTMQECSDHVVIYLENYLRDRSQAPPVPGIITPESADPAFALPTRLVRGLLEDYRQKTDYSDTINFYDPSPSLEWQALSSDGKLTRVQAAIERYPTKINVRIVRVEHENRIVVEFEESPATETKGRALMHLESYLKDEVEPTLQLWHQPQADKNKIRVYRINEEQTQ